jgi:hypothetical protein
VNEVSVRNVNDPVPTGQGDIYTTHMQVSGGVRQRPPTDFIHCEVAQGRESPGAGDLCQLRLTPVPLGEFTGLLLRDKLAGFYCGVFYCTLVFTLRMATLRHLPLQALGQGLRPGALEASADRVSSLVACNSAARV